MRLQIATTIEQSRRLLSCGVAPETADMVWLKFDYGFYLVVDTESNEDTPAEEIINVPAWSLSTLLELLLPPQIKPSWPDFDFCLLLRRSANGKWKIAYDHILEADSPIEACVQMIEWLCHTREIILEEDEFLKQ